VEWNHSTTTRLFKGLFGREATPHPLVVNFITTISFIANAIKVSEFSPKTDLSRTPETGVHNPVLLAWTGLRENFRECLVSYNPAIDTMISRVQ